MVVPVLPLSSENFYKNIRIMNIYGFLILMLFVSQKQSVHVVSLSNDAFNLNQEFTGVSYPRIGMLWRTVRGEQGIESMARHDLIMSGRRAMGLIPNREPVGLSTGFTDESIEIAKDRINQIRQINPDAVILVDLLFYEYPDEWLPEDHPWWLRKDGERQQFWPGTHRMDWSNESYRRKVIQQTVSLKETGINGVFYDNLRNDPEPWIAFLSDLRETIGDEFLILINAGYDVGTYNFAYPYINGVMYESGWSHDRVEWDECIKQMQYSQSLLREPKISLIERFEETRSRAGWPGDPEEGQKPPEDPAARRWSLCFALTIGDFYYLFSDNTSHRHDWYPEYDMKIGRPVEEGKRINSFVRTRKYDKALVVVNLPGALQDYTIELSEPHFDSLTGEKGEEFIIPPGDGRILLLE
jgi:hypothetical protein